MTSPVGGSKRVLNLSSLSPVSLPSSAAAAAVVTDELDSGGIAAAGPVAQY
jgi:hypothetical protein